MTKNVDKSQQKDDATIALEAEKPKRQALKPPNLGKHHAPSGMQPAYRLKLLDE